MNLIWTGLSFVVLGRRDGRFVHLPGLYGFARRDAERGALLLFAGQAEDLAAATGPAHPQWEEALRLGMDELHLHFPVPRRVDRLQLLARVVRHAQPLLNCQEEAHSPAAQAGPARLRA